MTPDEPNFNDPGLKQALRRQGFARPAPEELRRSIDGLFEAPPALPIRPSPRRIFAWAGAAAAVIVLGVALLISVTGSEDHDDEYLIRESTLWPAIASLHAAEQPVEPAAAGFRAAVLANAEFLGSNQHTSFAGVPAVITRYRLNDTTLTLVLADARKVLADTGETESYHEYAGDYQLVGGNRGDDWVCVVADRYVNVDTLNRAAAELRLETLPISGPKNP